LEHLTSKLSCASYTTNACTGLPDADHEAQMVESLQWHIWESLTGAPDDLPELKGLQAKLPTAFEGQDDFDCLDNWL
jgi:hypothetical protein